MHHPLVKFQAAEWMWHCLTAGHIWEKQHWGLENCSVGALIDWLMYLIKCLSGMLKWLQKCVQTFFSLHLSYGLIICPRCYHTPWWGVGSLAVHASLKVCVFTPSLVSGDPLNHSPRESMLHPLCIHPHKGSSSLITVPSHHCISLSKQEGGGGICIFSAKWAALLLHMLTTNQFH